MIELVERSSVGHERDAINVVGRQSPVPPCGFERLGDAHLPGVARIRVSS